MVHRMSHILERRRARVLFAAGGGTQGLAGPLDMVLLQLTLQGPAQESTSRTCVQWRMMQRLNSVHLQLQWQARTGHTSRRSTQCTTAAAKGGLVVCQEQHERGRS